MLRPAASHRYQVSVIRMGSSKDQPAASTIIPIAMIATKRYRLFREGRRLSAPSLAAHAAQSRADLPAPATTTRSASATAGSVH